MSKQLWSRTRDIIIDIIIYVYSLETTILTLAT
jgi:hypothetical protein